MLHLQGQPAAANLLVAMGSGLKFGTNAIPHIWQSVAVGLGYCSPNGTEQTPALYIDELSGIAVVADVFIDNRTELALALGFAEPLAQAPDSKLIVLAYLKWGRDFIQHLDGDFSFVLWDPHNNVLLCARDRFGVRPFIYTVTADRLFAFASHPSGLLALPELHPELNDHFVAAMLADIWDSVDESPFKEMWRLPPGHMLVVDQNGQLDLTCYWSPQALPERHYQNESDYAEEFNALLLDATKRRTDPVLQLGVELSGGLDSPSIICAAQQAITSGGGQPLHAFSHVLSDKDRGRVKPFLDEQSLSEDVCRFLGGIAYHPVSTAEKDLVLAIDEFYRAEGVPHIHTYSLHCDILLQRASEQGVKIMLSGAGGNQAASYQASGILVELARRGQFNRLWREAGIQAQQRMIASVMLVGRTVINAWLPRLEFFLRQKLGKISTAQKMHQDSQILQNNYAQQQHIQQRIAHRWGGLPTYTSVATQQALLLASPIFVSRLEHTWAAGARFGIEYRYPLLDRRLVEFILATPPIQKYKNGVGRYLMRTFLDRHGPKGMAWRVVNKAASVTIPSVYSQLKTSKASMLAQIEVMRGSSAITSRIDIDKLLEIIEKIDETVENINGYEQLLLKKAFLLAPFLRQYG